MNFEFNFKSVEEIIRIASDHGLVLKEVRYIGLPEGSLWFAPRAVLVFEKSAQGRGKKEFDNPSHLFAA